MIIRSNRIYFEDGLKCGYLEVRDGKFGRFTMEPPTEDFIDYGNDRVIPGIFDTHNHGTCGYGLMPSDNGGMRPEDNVRGFLKGCASQGITGVFPTAGLDMIGAVAEVAATGADGAAVLGIHSEGPWLNRVGEKGVHTGWPEVRLDTVRKMIQDGRGLLKLVSLAPEIPGMEAVIRLLLAEGVTVGYAHSDMNFTQARAAYSLGITVATHTGNVMTGLHHRDIGGLGASLMNEDVWCEVICDGMHICLDMLRIYFALKDPSRFMMISDCTPFSGAPAGVYRGWTPSMSIHVGEDGFVLSDTGRLCGSSQPVLFGIGNLVEKLGMPMEQVIRMASLNPCVKYGFADTKGSIRSGKDADFTVISDGYSAIATYVCGRKVYDRAREGAVFNPDFMNAMRVQA